MHLKTKQILYNISNEKSNCSNFYEQKRMGRGK